jgi:hypothetical protein
MALNQLTVEQLGAWCFNTEQLATERKKAWAIYFGEDDPRPVKYWGGTEEKNSRERRFLGWFMFDHTLRGGEKAAEVAVRRLFPAGLQGEPLEAIASVRYVNAVVSSVLGRSVFLELEEESFEVRSPIWAANLQRSQAIVAHIVPVRHRYWLPGPGWLVWSVSIGPGMREAMKSFQVDPIQVEQFLQGRSASEGKPQRKVPKDRTFAAAVARMSDWARQHGYAALVLNPDEWQSLVLKHLRTMRPTAMAGDLLAMVGSMKSEDDFQTVLDLSMNIWNNTPLPDRGGKSARELGARRGRDSATGGNL